MNSNSFSEYIARLALKSLLYEVAATPKPGLVDRNNSGAHRDMDFFTFMSSSAAIADVFRKCAMEGINFDLDDSTLLLKNIRPIGIEGEKRMFEATNNVNTHKGLIFSLGIITAAAGNLYKKSEGRITFSPDEISSKVREITKGICHEFKEIDNKEKLTYGEMLYKKYGIKGIRGEVESGFETVIKVSLPIMKKLVEEKKGSINDILVETLIHLMANTEDSNILGRHNLEVLSYVKEMGRKAIKLGGFFSGEGRNFIEEMDRDFIGKNISPGGSADLLAVTIMFFLLEKGDII